MVTFHIQGMSDMFVRRSDKGFQVMFPQIMRLLNKKKSKVSNSKRKGINGGGNKSSLLLNISVAIVIY